MSRRIHTAVIIAALAALLGFSPLGIATELVWQPVNPSFGGNPYNGSWLLSQATAQNKYLGRSSASSSRSLLDNFEERLYSQALYQLSNDILEDAYGEGGQLYTGEDEENLSIGSYDINIVKQEGQYLTLSIVDTAGGGKTVVKIPLTWQSL